MYKKLKKIYQSIVATKRSYKDDFEWVKNSKNILDVPCGQGYFISNDPTRIVGVDLNDIAIEQCEKKGYKVFKQNALNLEFDDSSFDAIHCAHLIEHLMPDDASKLLRELDRVLKKDGILIIRTPMLHKLFYNEPSHIRPYPPSAIMSLLNVVDQGDPTLYDNNLKYEFRDIKFYHSDLFQFQFEVAAAPKYFMFFTLLKVFGKLFGLLRIKSFSRTEYSLCLIKK